MPQAVSLLSPVPIVGESPLSVAVLSLLENSFDIQACGSDDAGMGPDGIQRTPAAESPGWAGTGTATSCPFWIEIGGNPLYRAVNVPAIRPVG